MDEETISLKGEVIKTYEYGDLMVLVYKVTADAPAPLDDFFLVTLDDTSTEVAWGLGADEEEALQNAAEALDHMPPNDNDFNPFKKALEDLKGEKP
jgi:hypothetical protein